MHLAVMQPRLTSRSQRESSETFARHSVAQRVRVWNRRKHMELAKSAQKTANSLISSRSSAS